MTGPLTLPFGTPFPAYIPPEIDMTAVQAQVAADGVSAPPARKDEEPALRQVVADARGDGIDLKIVVVDTVPPVDTPLRDIATVVGQDNPGSTVLVLGPPFAGSYSSQFSRVTLEAGEDLAKNGDVVQSSKNFVSQLNTPLFPWTTLTIVLTTVILLIAIGTRFLQVRSKSAAAVETADTLR